MYYTAFASIKSPIIKKKQLQQITSANIVAFYSQMWFNNGLIIMFYVDLIFIKGDEIMARVCQVTGKKPMSGNNVSHANNRTKRRFLPNLQYRKLWVESENRWVRLRLSNAALRTIDKNGIESVLAELRASGLVI